MAILIMAISFYLTVVQSGPTDLAGRNTNGAKQNSMAADVSVMKTSFVKAHDNAEIPRLGYRFTGEETDEYISKIVQFILLFTDVRMIELPAGREELVINAWRETKVPREEIFFVYKLNFKMVGVDDTRYELDNVLERCGLDYIDLYLIHFLDTKGFYVVTWKTMIDMRRQGKVKYIGVSNALHSYVTFLYRQTGILPSVVQLEANPYFQQAMLTEQFQDMGIVVQAYSIMASGEKMHEPRLQRIAKKYNMTTGQLLVQWCLQKSLSCLTTSRKLHRVAENFYESRVTIAAEDMESLDELEENLVHHFDPYDTEHLQSVDLYIKEKMKTLEDDGYWESKRLSNMKHISIAEDFDPSEKTADDKKQNNTSQEMNDVSETMPPLYMSSDIDTEITPEVLEIIREEEKKLKANGLYDNDYKESINQAYESASEALLDRGEETDFNSQSNRERKQVESNVFKIDMKDISSTCKRLSRETFENLLQENEKSEL